MTDVEFFVPVAIVGGSVADTPNAAHFLDATVDVEGLTATQQVDLLAQVTDALRHQRHAAGVFEHMPTLYAFIVAMHGPTGGVSRGCRTRLVDDCASRLADVATLTRRATERNGARDVALRSLVKMYAFVICGVLLAHCPDAPVEAAPSASQGTQSRGAGGRQGKKRVRVDSDVDGSGVGLLQREQALHAMCEALDAAQPLWESGHADGALLRLLLRTVFHMLRQTANVSGEGNPVQGCLVELLLATAQRYIAARSATEDGAGHPRDAVAAEMVESFIRNPNAVTAVVTALSEARLSEGCGDLVTWSLEHIINLASGEIDVTAAKSFATFIEESCRSAIGLLAANLRSFVLPLCQADVAVRKAAVIALGELLAHGSEGEDANVIAAELLERLRDINGFIRLACLKVWSRLVQAGAVPRAMMLSLANAVAARQRDSYFNARAEATRCLIHLAQKRVLHGQSLSVLRCTKEADESIVTARETCGEDAEERIESAIGAPRPSGQEDPIASAARSVATLRFAQLFQAALDHAYKALYAGPTTQDRLGAIELTVVAARTNIDGWVSAVLRTFSLIHATEPNVQEAVVAAFVEIFGRRSSTSGASPWRTRALVAVMAASNDMDVHSLHVIFRRLSETKPLDVRLLDSVWGLVEDASVDAVERRLAMRLYAALTTCAPQDVQTRRPRVIEAMKVLRSDCQVVTSALHALRQEAMAKGFVSIPPHHADVQLVKNLLQSPSARITEWMPVAEAGVAFLYACFSAADEIVASVVEHLFAIHAESSDRVAQVLTVLGSSLLRRLAAIDDAEAAELRAVDAAGDVADADAMAQELGAHSVAFLRDQVRDKHAALRRSTIGGDGSTPQTQWSRYAALVTQCASMDDVSLPVRIAAALALTRFMVAHEGYCEQNIPRALRLLHPTSPWVVRNNAMVAMSDLVCVHPHIVETTLYSAEGLPALLSDADPRVRAVAVQVCTHLATQDMLRLRDHLHAVVRLVADVDETIADHAIQFIAYMASREKDKVGNLVPALVGHLGGGAMTPSQFTTAMQPLLAAVVTDKAVESLIQRLSERFGRFSENPARRSMAWSVAHCIGQLSPSERAVRCLSSATVFGRYKGWLRDSSITEMLLAFAEKAKKEVDGNVRRDAGIIDEWIEKMRVEAGLSTPAAALPAQTQAAVAAGAASADQRTPESDTPTPRSRRPAPKQKRKRRRGDSDDDDDESSDDEEPASTPPPPPAPPAAAPAPDRKGCRKAPLAGRRCN